MRTLAEYSWVIVVVPHESDGVELVLGIMASGEDLKGMTIFRVEEGGVSCEG